MVKQVLLCGCGNIGFRHLQAMSMMRTPVAITIVEPFEGGHARINDFVHSDAAGGADRFNLLARLPETRQRFDLVVIATSSDTRQAAFRDIVARHDVGLVLFEKILFQSVRAVNDVAADLEHLAIPAFVNCGRRGFDSYRALAAAFADRGPVHVEVTGGAFGLASNAVHFLDLAEFLNHSPMTDIDLSGVDAGAVESKRAGFVEIFGTLRASLENGATLSVSCADTPSISIAITLTQGDRVLKIDEMGGTVTENGETKPFEVKYVSGMPYLYDDALQAADPGLTPYDASARQHRFYLSAMCRHLGLPEGDDTTCPVS